MHCSIRLIVQTLVFSRSYLHRQVSAPETLVVKRGTTWARNGRWILPENARLPRNIHGYFTCRKSTTWDKQLNFASEGRRAEDFFALKNPTALAGFEPANLGTKVQHATSRPPKPFKQICNWHCNLKFSYINTSWSKYTLWDLWNKWWLLLWHLWWIFLFHKYRNLFTVCSRVSSVMVVITSRIGPKGIGFRFSSTCTNFSLSKSFRNPYGAHLDPYRLGILGRSQLVQEYDPADSRATTVPSGYRIFVS